MTFGIDFPFQAFTFKNVHEGVNKVSQKLAAHATQLDTDPIWLIPLFWDLPLLHLDISDYQQIAGEKKRKDKRTSQK